MQFANRSLCRRVRWVIGFSCPCLIVGSSCWFPDGGRVFDPFLPLDLTEATITIHRLLDDTESSVEATLTDGAAGLVLLDEGQSISVNDESLTGPDAFGTYRVLVAAADAYVITVSEPSRGVAHTRVEEPAAFEIMSPGDGDTASLSGFTLTWSDADSGLLIRVRLSQDILGLAKSRTVGPVVDRGSVVLTAEMLSEFQQGAPIEIELTKINEVGEVDGFRSVDATVELTRSLSISPGP